MPRPSIVGRNTYFGEPIYVFNDKTSVGSFCSISWNVCLGTTNHPTNWLSTHIFQYSRRPDLYDIKIPDEKILTWDFNPPVTVGNDVWIGCDVVILDGITIGDGAVIGAGAVVTKDVPSYAIVAGVPAKVLKYRFSQDIIDELLQLKWWDLPDEDIRDLPFDNVEECIKILKEKKLNSTINSINFDKISNLENLMGNIDA